MGKPDPMQDEEIVVGLAILLGGVLVEQPNNHKHSKRWRCYKPGDDPTAKYVKKPRGFGTKIKAARAFVNYVYGMEKKRELEEAKANAGSEGGV